MRLGSEAVPQYLTPTRIGVLFFPVYYTPHLCDNSRVKVNQTLAWIVVAAALLVPSAQADKYNHIGTLESHAPKMKDLIEGRTDLYYAGEYICTPGSEHYAPDCRKITDWFVKTRDGYTTFTLDDGTVLVNTDSDSTDFNSVFFRLAPFTSPGSSHFLYHLGKIKNGMQEIDLKGAGKAYYKLPDRTVHKDQHCLSLPSERQAECLAATK